jgi:hypothetical protein
MRNRDPDQFLLELAILLLALAVAVQLVADRGFCLQTDSAPCAIAAF